MKRTTIYLTPEVHEKLVKLAERKKWSVTKIVEFILLKTLKDRTNAKESNS
jgi:predicted HicB family RNase H-like nuclease